MIGQLKAVGTPVPSPRQSVFEAAQLAQDAETGPLLPIVNSQQAAERVLRSAVATIEFTREAETRPLPNGDDSDRFSHADREQRTSLTETVGTNVDVTA